MKENIFKMSKNTNEIERMKKGWCFNFFLYLTLFYIIFIFQQFDEIHWICSLLLLLQTSSFLFKLQQSFDIEVKEAKEKFFLLFSTWKILLIFLLIFHGNLHIMRTDKVGIYEKIVDFLPFPNKTFFFVIPFHTKI